MHPLLWFTSCGHSLAQTWPDGFEFLQSYCIDALLVQNPGSIVELKTSVGEDGKEEFSSLFVQLDGMANIFAGGLPVAVYDGGHLNGYRWGGV